MTRIICFFAVAMVAAGSMTLCVSAKEASQYSLSAQQIYERQCNKKMVAIDSVERQITPGMAISQKTQILSRLARMSVNMPQEEKYVRRALKAATSQHDTEQMKKYCLSLCRIYSDRNDRKQVKYWLGELGKLSVSDTDKCFVLGKYYDIVTDFWNNDVRGAWNNLLNMKKSMREHNCKFGVAVCTLLEAQIYSFVGKDDKACNLVDEYLSVLADDADLMVVNIAYDAASALFFINGDLEKGKTLSKQWREKARKMQGAAYEDVAEALWVTEFNRAIYDVYSGNVKNIGNSLKTIWDTDFVPNGEALRQYVLLRCTKSLYEGEVKYVERDVDYLMKHDNRYHYQYLYLLAMAYRGENSNERAVATLRNANDVLRKEMENKLLLEISQYGQMSKQFDEEIVFDKARLRDARVLHILLLVALVAVAVAIMVLIVILYRNYKKTHRLKALNEDLKKKRRDVETLNANLVEAISKESESNVKKNEFVANMSHEIRTPLNAIVGFSDILAAALGEECKEEGREYASLIRTNSELLLKLVDGIIDKNANSDDVPELTEVDVADLAHRVLLSLVALVKDGVEMRFESDCEKITINTDRFRLQQLLTNLIGNAIKFTEKGFVLLEVKQDDAYVAFVVTDTGKGIEPGKEKAIFEKFERNNEEKIQGFGLGLYICRAISSMLHGELYVDDTYKGGARFVFKHPVNLKAEENGKEAQI